MNASVICSDGIMVSTMDILFSDWLSKELKKREWNQSDLARRAGVTRGGISNLLNNVRNPGPEILEGIAKALDYPPTVVFRKAGLLPKEEEYNPTNEELLHLYNQLDENEQEEIRKWIRFKVEENKRKERE